MCSTQRHHLSLPSASCSFPIFYVRHVIRFRNSRDSAVKLEQTATPKSVWLRLKWCDLDLRTQIFSRRSSTVSQFSQRSPFGRHWVSEFPCVQVAERNQTNDETKSKFFASRKSILVWYVDMSAEPVNGVTRDNCFVCGKLSSTKCSNCTKVFYCSVEHQRRDWKRHKQNCHPFSVSRRFFYSIFWLFRCLICCCDTLTESTSFRIFRLRRTRRWAVIWWRVATSKLAKLCWKSCRWWVGRRR